MKIYTSLALRLITLSLLPFSSHTASAEDFEVDGIHYNITADTEVEIIYNGSYSTLTGIKVPDGVIRLGESAFYDCVSLTEIIHPSALNDVGENTFQNCPLRKVRYSFVPR